MIRTRNFEALKARLRKEINLYLAEVNLIENKPQSGSNDAELAQYKDLIEVCSELETKLTSKINSRRPIKIITYKDGFQFEVISREEAVKEWKKGAVYGLDLGSETEALIESVLDLERFDYFGYEIGFKDE